MKTISHITSARILAAAFILPGIAGLFSNPLIGPEGIFVTNGAHNLVHLVTAALFLLTSTRSEAAAQLFTRTFGVVYLLVGVVGFFFLSGAEEGMLLGLIHINQIDNFLHVGLGALITAIGFALPAQSAADPA